MSEEREKGLFDRLAGAVAAQTARAWFFAACVFIVVVWAPSILVFRNIDTWQLVINTLTTIVTFLMVALLQNSQARDTTAIQKKLDAIARGVIDLMEEHGGDAMREDIEELEHAIGLEDEIGTKG